MKQAGHNARRVVARRVRAEVATAPPRKGAGSQTRSPGPGVPERPCPARSRHPRVFLVNRGQRPASGGGELPTVRPHTPSSGDRLGHLGSQARLQAVTAGRRLDAWGYRLDAWGYRLSHLGLQGEDGAARHIG